VTASASAASGSMTAAPCSSASFAASAVLPVNGAPQSASFTGNARSGRSAGLAGPPTVSSVTSFTTLPRGSLNPTGSWPSLGAQSVPGAELR